MMKIAPEVGLRVRLPSGRTACVIAFKFDRYICRFEDSSGVSLPPGSANEASFTEDFLRRWAAVARPSAARAAGVYLRGVM